jgi:poly(A) polymerase
LRDIFTLQRLHETHGPVDLYDAGERVARQLMPMLRALGSEQQVDLPDFSMWTLLAGDEIASLAAIPPGPRVGQLKRALLAAQLAGKVATREDAVTFIAASV